MEAVRIAPHPCGKINAHVQKLLTENAPNCAPAVPFEIRERREPHHELVEQAPKGPQVRLPAVLLLAEEFWRRILHCAEECRGWLSR